MNYLTHTIPILEYSKPKGRPGWRKSKRVYTQAQMSKRTGIPAPFIRLLIDAGVLESYTRSDGRCVYYNPSEWSNALNRWKTCLAALADKGEIVYPVTSERGAIRVKVDKL